MMVAWAVMVPCVLAVPSAHAPLVPRPMLESAAFPDVALRVPLLRASDPGAPDRSYVMAMLVIAELCLVRDGEMASEPTFTVPHRSTALLLATLKLLLGPMTFVPLVAVTELFLFPSVNPVLPVVLRPVPNWVSWLRLTIPSAPVTAPSSTRGRRRE